VFHAEKDLVAAASVDPVDDDVRRLLESTRLDIVEKAKEERALQLDTDGALVSDVDTPQAAASPAWDASIAALVSVLASSTSSSSSSPSVTCGQVTASQPALRIPRSTFDSVLRHLDIDDARVALRTSGALAALGDLILVTSTFFRDGSGTGPIADATTFVGACMTLAAAADNDKNRLLLRSSGVLLACLDTLAAPDSALLPRLSQVVSNTSLGAVSACREVACAALHVVDAACRKGASVDSRAAVARHGFVSPRVPSSVAAVVATPGHTSIAERLASLTSELLTAPLSTLTGPGGVLECAELCARVLQSLAAGGSAYDAYESAAAKAKAPQPQPPLPITLAPFDALSTSWGPLRDGLNVVPALLDVASALLQRAAKSAAGEPGAQLLSSTAMQCCVGALANLAQLPSLRCHFVDPPVRAGAAVSTPVSPHRIQPLLKLLVAAVATGTAQGAEMASVEGWLTVLSGAVAALANACLGTSAVTDALCASGVPLALLRLVTQQLQERGVLRELDESMRLGGGYLVQPGALASCSTEADDRLGKASAAVELTARAGALLARTSSHPVVVAMLEKSENLVALTSAFSVAAACAPALLVSVHGPVIALLQDSLIRAVAAAVSASRLASIDTFMRSGGLPALVAVMRAQLASVSAHPSSSGEQLRSEARFIGIGNACTLLGSLLDEGTSAAVRRDHVLSEGCVDVLVDALKLNGGSDSPLAGGIRKNASVALARAVRDSACMARARELRGIEILIQLQMSK
jgi:hypothetical protein